MREAKIPQSSFTVPVWTFLAPVIGVMLLLIVIAQRPDGRLHIWVLDVGQGDAILVRTPMGITALIDGGPAATPLLNEMGEHLPFWQRDLDLLVLTHPHADHMMGLVDVLQRYQVGQVVQTEFSATGSLEGEWLTAVKRQGMPVRYPKPDDTISFQGEPEIQLRVLSQSRAAPADRTRNEDVNDESVVLRLTYGRNDILLEGDAQRQAEAEISNAYGGGIASEILKVGHHGSSSSSAPEFVSQVRPRIAIISVGAGNKYGHPSSQTLQTLKEANAIVYRTDLHGTVEIIADKQQMWVRSER